MKLSYIVILVVMSAYLGMYEIHNFSYAQEKKLTIEDIKKNYKDRPIKNIIPFKEDFVLVEWQKPTFANRFDLYNLKTGEMNFVYGTTNYVKVQKIVDEDRIIFFADGRESETRYWEFPFLEDCRRVADSEKFIHFKEKKICPHQGLGAIWM